MSTTTLTIWHTHCFACPVRGFFAQYRHFLMSLFSASRWKQRSTDL